MFPEEKLSDVVGALADLLDTLDKDKATASTLTSNLSLSSSTTHPTMCAGSLKLLKISQIASPSVCHRARLPLLGVILFERFMDYVGPMPTPPFDLIVAILSHQSRDRGKR